MHRLRNPALRLALLLGSILLTLGISRAPRFQALWTLYQLESCTTAAFNALPAASALHPAIECVQQSIPKLGESPEAWRLMEWTLNARTTHERHPLYMRQVLRTIIEPGRWRAVLVTTLLEAMALLAAVIGAAAVIRQLRWEEAPAKTDARTRTAPRVEPAARHVLVIDDDPTFARGVARMLKSKGISSDVATSWTDAEKKLLSTRYDTIFCDYFLDQGHGSQLCLETLGKNAYKSCVMLSGISEEQLTTLPEPDRTFTFLLKPCDSRLLERFAKAGVS